MADAAAGGGGAAPQPKPVAELRAEAAAAGAPAALPDAALPYWLLFSQDSLTLKLYPKGLFVVPRDTQAATYCGYFSPRFIDGKFKLQCRMFGCEKMISYMEVSGKTGKAVFPFQNSFTHLLSCRGHPAPHGQGQRLQGRAPPSGRGGWGGLVLVCWREEVAH